MSCHGPAWSRCAIPIIHRSYCGSPPAPDALGQSWNLDPALLIGLGLLAAYFGWSRSRLASTRAGWCGVIVLAVAFVSPLCALTNALFSARVVHHLLLIAVAAPLFAIAMRPPARPPGVGPALIASTVTLWVWHVPAVYSAALSSVAIYWLMQASLIGTALWFWRAALHPASEGVAALVAIVGAMAQMGMLGALLTFAPDPLYAEHLATPRAYGLAPMEDQQLAGLIMWVPAMLPYFLLASLVARRAWPRLMTPA